MMMMNARMLVPLVGVSIFLFGGCSGRVEDSAAAAIAPDTAVPLSTLPISMNAVMMGVIDHASHIIWKAADTTTAPHTEADWTEVRRGQDSG